MKIEYFQKNGVMCMIIYAAKQTVDRYEMTMPENFMDLITKSVVQNTYDLEKDNSILEWGAKIFYFDGRKCIQVCNFASKLTFVLIDIKKSELEIVGDLIARYLLELYAGNKKMIKLLKRMFNEHPVCLFAKFTNKKIIASMNSFQLTYIDTESIYYNSIENGILKTIDINKKINKELYVARYDVGGKKNIFSRLINLKNYLPNITANN